MNVNISAKCYLLLKHLLYARRSQEEDFESRYLAAYGHPDAAEYLFIRHLYDMLPRASGPSERFLSFHDRNNYVVMFPPHLWDCEGDTGIDRGGFEVVTVDYRYARQLLNTVGDVPKLGIVRAVSLFMTDLGGVDWAQVLEKITVHERHFLTPMKLTEVLAQHYMQIFYPQFAASTQPVGNGAAPPAAQAQPIADSRPPVALDPALRDSINQHDGWI